MLVFAGYKIFKKLLSNVVFGHVVSHNFFYNFFAFYDFCSAFGLNANNWIFVMLDWNCDGYVGVVGNILAVPSVWQA